MKKYIFSTVAIVAAGLSVYAAAAAADDPVLMTVNNHDIRLQHIAALIAKIHSFAHGRQKPRPCADFLCHEKQ